VVEEEQGATPSAGARGCGYIGCIAIIVVLVGTGVAFFALGNAVEPLADRFLWQPQDVVREYFTAYRAGDVPRAQLLLCEGVAGPLDPLEPLGTRAGAPFVEDAVPYPRGGDQVAIYYRVDQFGPRAQALLQREEEGWRICAFE
jgi:hypothetical protein